jgi:hypothetical protein
MRLVYLGNGMVEFYCNSVWYGCYPKENIKSIVIGYVKVTILGER